MNQENKEDNKVFDLSKFHINSAVNSLLIVFSTIALLVWFGDAIMSYVLPNYIQLKLDNSGVLMGLMLALQSLLGAILDFLFGKWFKYKKFRFFLKWTFLFAIIFPLIFILFPAQALFFIAAMISWGTYQELLVFANSQFIDSYTKRQDHSFAWGIVTAFKSISYTIGPIIAQLLLDKGEQIPFLAAMGFYIAGLVGFIFMQNSKKVNKHLEKEKIVRDDSFRHEAKIWAILIKRLWHLLIFFIILSFIDATFWTVGAILSIELSSKGAPAGIFLALYSLPSLFVAIILNRVAKPFGKKKIALITAFISSLLLIGIGLTSNIMVILGIVLVSSTFSAISWPALRGAFSDYIQRLDGAKNDLIGIESWITNLSFIIGPIIAGFISDRVGAQKTFSIVGIIASVCIFLILLVIPKKIKMPQKELKE